MGNILIIKDGLETSSIPETRRDKALLDFFHMKNMAEMRGHIFHLSEAVFFIHILMDSIIPDLLI